MYPRFPHRHRLSLSPNSYAILQDANTDRETYARILERADKVTYVSDKYTNFCMQKRNQYMVDHSDIVFAFWNENKTSGGTYNTIQYAKKKNKQLELFVLNNY